MFLLFLCSVYLMDRTSSPDEQVRRIRFHYQPSSQLNGFPLQPAVVNCGCQTDDLLADRSSSSPTNSRKASEANRNAMVLFAETTPINGIKELTQDGSKILKCVWAMFLMGSLVMMAQQLVLACVEYSREPTMTKVILGQVPSSNLNEMAICFSIHHLYEVVESMHPEILHSDEFLFQLGHTEPALPILATKFSHWLKGSLVDDKAYTLEEFVNLPSQNTTELFTRYGNKNIQEYLSHILNISHIEADPFENTRIYMISGKVVEKSAINVLGSDAICLSGNMKGEQDAFKVRFEIPLRKGKQHPTHFDDSYIYYNHYDTNILYPYFSYFSIAAPDIPEHNNNSEIFRELSQMISAQKFTYRNLRRRPCHDSEGAVYPVGQGFLVCQTACVDKAIEKRHKCGFSTRIMLGAKEASSRKHVPSCHWYDLMNDERHQRVGRCRRLSDRHPNYNSMCAPKNLSDWGESILNDLSDWVFNDVSKKCREKCKDFRFCEEWQVTRYLLHELTHINAQKSEKKFHGLVTEMYVTKPYTMTIYQEDLRFSIEEFVGNLGGILSFYFGLSVVSMVHVFFFCLYQWLARRKQAKIEQAEKALDKPKKYPLSKKDAKEKEKEQFDGIMTTDVENNIEDEETNKSANP